MEYYLLRQDARLDRWQALFVEDVSLDALRAGLPIDMSATRVRVTVSALGPEPSDFLELPCLVVSDTMRRALDGAGVDNVQYFPAHVEMQYTEGTAATDYWAANVVGAVACVKPLPADALLTAREVGGPAPGFRIDAKRARGFDLFRLAEDRRLLVVSERVAMALRAAGLRGLVLQEPETYTGLPVSTAPGEPELARGR